MTDDILQILFELLKWNVLPSRTRGQTGIVGSEENNLRLVKMIILEIGRPLITIMWTEAWFSLGMKSGKTLSAIAVLYPLPLSACQPGWFGTVQVYLKPLLITSRRLI